MRRIASWSASRIAALWREDIGIDVSGLFDGVDVVSLWHADKSDLQFFHPIVIGDAGLYDALRSKNWYVQPEKWEFREAAAHIADTDRVLDLGAGARSFAAYVAPDRYVASDPHADENGPADPDRRFDVVCAFQVLEHVADPLAFVAEAKARLNPGGLLFIGVPNRESYVGRLRDFPLDMPPHHVMRWSRRALAALAAAANLSVESIDASPLEPWEAPLYWIFRLESILPRTRAGRSRWGRLFAYGAARGLQNLVALPSDIPGGSLLMRARI